MSEQDIQNSMQDMTDQIQEMINEEVEQRLKNAIPHYEKKFAEMKETQKDVTATAKKYQEIEARNKELKEEMDQKYAEGIQEGQRSVLKFNYNDTAYLIRFDYTLETCETCKGKDKVQAYIEKLNMSKNISCPNCEMSGKKRKWFIQVLQVRIKEAQYHIWARGNRWQWEYWVEGKGLKDSVRITIRHDEKYEDLQDGPHSANLVAQQLAAEKGYPVYLWEEGGLK